MGLTSGRGSRGGAGRQHDDGHAARGAGPQGRTGLVGGTASGGTASGGGGTVGGRRRAAGRRSPLGWAGAFPVPVFSAVAIVASAALIVAGVGVSRMLTVRSAANATLDKDCTLIVPANPLSAQGLATPYRLTATNPAQGPCNEADANQTAFVQGAIIDPATGKISVYDPLVIDAGTKPAVTPAPPVLPAGAVVALWFGFNGHDLRLAGADQAPAAASAAASAPSSAAPAMTTSPSTAPSSTATATATPSVTATPSAVATPTSAATPTMTGAPAQSSASATATASATASATAAALGAPPRASVESNGSAPLSPRAGGTAGWYNASLSRVNDGGGKAGGQQSSHATPPASAKAQGRPSATPASRTSGQAIPPSNPADKPAAAPASDAILDQANCVAGESFGGTFSSFTQVGACNAVAFFTAANAAIKAGKLTVPRPGTAKDGKSCLTTRSFALIDQDQSDNVTTEYLAAPGGQTAQDTAANRGAMPGASTLVNGSDNGLLDLFVAPALGCSPWTAPNLADNGAPAPALPLDELQAAAWAGHDGNGPAALVPLNDPMTLDPSGNYSTDKTNTYRSLMDIPSLPAGESPAAYCSDMERIQGARLQQDVNLLIPAPTPAPAAADNLFTFLAMRLQQSFTNLDCGAFGMTNAVSVTTNGSGVVVAACFQSHAAPLTAGPGNPMAGKTECPATTGGPAPTPVPSHQGGCHCGNGYATRQSTASAAAARSYYGDHHHG